MSVSNHYEIFADILCKNKIPYSKKKHDDFIKWQKEDEKRVYTEVVNNKISELFGEKFVNSTFQSYQANKKEQKEVLTVCKNYSAMSKENGESIILYGNSGTGKTHLIVSMVRSIIFDVEVAYIEKINTEKIKLQKDGKDWMRSLSHYCSCKMLVFPDLIIRSSGLSESVKEVLFYIIDSRYNRKLPVIIATNTKIKDFLSMIDYDGFCRLKDRLKEIVGDRICCFDWESYR